MHSVFPVIDCGGIDAELVCKLPLREPSGPAGRTETSGKGGGRCRGIVAQKPSDGGIVLDGGVGCVAFPEGEGLGIDPDLLGNLLLEKSEVHPAGTDVVA